MATKRRGSWMQSSWRPMMAYLYMLICFTDFVLFPVLWVLMQSSMHIAMIAQWQPLTLQSAGLFHLAMGGVLGVSAYGRSKEKLAGAADSSGYGSPAESTMVPQEPQPEQ